jgi:hypothetical protein
MDKPKIDYKKVGKHFKKGPPSNGDIAFIGKNAETMSDEQMAEALNRSVDFVQKIRVQQPVKMKAEEGTDIITALRVKHWWNTIRKQLFEEEITFFESTWANLNTQFEDVVPTDELVLRDLIMYDILANRNLTQQKSVMDTVTTLQSQINNEYKLAPELRDRGALSDWNTQINSCRSAHLSLQKSYSDIDDRKVKSYQSLKSTREQRYKLLKESKNNFFDMLQMLDSREMKIKEGRYMELFKIATEREKVRFEQEVDYTGNGDSNGVPMLTPELIEQRFQEQIEDFHSAVNNFAEAINEKKTV